MKTYTVDDLIKIIEKQQTQIEMLEKQVNIMMAATDDKPKDKNKITDGETSNANARIQDIEDVVTDLKGDMMELMLVYQDIQDKIFDIDRCVNYPLTTKQSNEVLILGPGKTLLCFTI